LMRSQWLRRMMNVRRLFGPVKNQQS